MTETEFLQNYDITQFDRPSLTTDIVLFALSNDNKNIRNISIDGLQVLLIKRATHPYKDQWSLPGGFCRPSESIPETAHRELFEETGIDKADLQLINTYSDNTRDPRGWIISNAYMGMVHKSECQLRADTDAWDAKWFNVCQLPSCTISKTADNVCIEHHFELYCDETKEVLHATIHETRKSHGSHIHRTFTLCNSDLGFDHGLIIGETLLHLKQTLQHDIRPLFSFMPELFTIGELKTAYEIITGKPVQNFRRMINDYVIETTSIYKAGYRPAALYERNLDMFLA